VHQELKQKFNCCPVFLGAELKDKYYKGEGGRGRERGRAGSGSAGLLLPGSRT
jgi:hypothetical protein